MPTILDLLGIPTPLPLAFRAPATAGTFPQDLTTDLREVSLHGRSLLPLLRGEADRVRDFALTGHHRQSWSLQDQEWRYQVFLDGSRPPELFHLPSDPYDQRNVRAEHPAVAERLELALRRAVADLG
jgi:arylsulfatase A-like enzyme